VLDNVEIAHSERSHAQPNQLFLNEGGRFTVAPPERLGPGVGDPYVTRGTAAGDLDGDGFQDVLVGNNRGPAQVLLSRPRSDEWLRVELEGPPGNPHALGATLWIVTGDGERILRRVKSARSYASASEPAVVTGVPGGCRSVEVLWPDGARSETPMTANGSPATGGTRILRHPALLGHERVRQDG
jgi:hypothetical protein